MSVPKTTSDVLGSVLREVSFASAAYRWIEMGAPFRLVFDRPGLRGVHLIAAGSCELVLADGAVTPLTAGDTVILPRGDDHELRSGRAATATSGFEPATPAPGARLRGGGPGRRRRSFAARSWRATPTTRRSAACLRCCSCPAWTAARHRGWRPTRGAAPGGLRRRPRQRRRDGPSEPPMRYLQACACTTPAACFATNT